MFLIAAADVTFCLVSFYDTAYWPLTVYEGPRPNFMAEGKKFALSTVSRLALRPIQPPVNSYRRLFPDVKGQSLKSLSFSPLPRYTKRAALFLYSRTHFLVLCLGTETHFTFLYRRFEKWNDVGRCPLCLRKEAVEHTGLKLLHVAARK